MTPDEELIAELKKINQKLDIISHPLKIAWFNFRSGVFHSLGNLFVTVVLAALAVYLLSSLNLNQVVNNWVQGIMKQIDITKLVPQPQTQFQYQDVIDKYLPSQP